MEELNKKRTGTVISQKKPLQSSWFKIGRGYLCFAILKPPNFAITLEVRESESGWEIALSAISFSVVYHWEKLIDGEKG